MRARIAVVGAGWAGLAAAVEARRAGYAVTVFEAARHPGGRARAVGQGEAVLDNGQHILIGAYTETLRLMREVGVDTAGVLLRTPLRIGNAQGRGLYLPQGAPLLAFTRAVLKRRGWTWRDRLTLLAAAGSWAAARFRCRPGTTVLELTRGLTTDVRRDLIDPLCVAALNTPAVDADAAVFLTVLRDALFSGRGSADLLLPRVDLGSLFPAPAVRWLLQSGAEVRLGHRVARLQPDPDRGWIVEHERFDGVLLAVPPGEAARLTADIAPDWAQRAAAFDYEPIVTVYVDSPGTRLPEAMLCLPDGPDAPAQFVFDRGRLGGPAGLLAFVVSGARPWVERGTDATVQAVLNQARSELGPLLQGEPMPRLTIAEKRATFRCTPGLRRPPSRVASGLAAAGDHVEGPYPATLEGAVRSGVAAIRAWPWSG